MMASAVSAGVSSPHTAMPLGSVVFLTSKSSIFGLLKKGFGKARE